MATSLGLSGEISLSKSKEIEWTIASFFSLSAIKDDYYDSPSFIFGNTTWHLRIYPGGFSKASPGRLSVYLVNKSNIPRHVSFIFRIKKADGRSIHCGMDSKCITSSRGFKNFYERSVLKENESELVPSGNLTIICNLTLNKDEDAAFATEEAKKVDKKQVDGTVDHNTFTATDGASSLKSCDFAGNKFAMAANTRLRKKIDSLSKNFKDLYTNEDCWDTVLLVQGKKFKVHKAILIPRSPVFAAMFRHDTVEKQTGKVTINDCDPDSFRQFLEYLYCGRLEDMSFNSALHLYSTSDKYNVQELKTFCIQYLIQNLTVQNICDVITLADQYDETYLLSSAQKFFSKNLKGILVTSEWEDLFKRKFRLANKLLVEMSNAKD